MDKSIKSLISNKNIGLFSLLLSVVAFRLLPHPYNFTPAGALALFAGAKFADRRLAYLVPLALLFATDLVLGLHLEMPFVYLGFAMMVALGGQLRGKESVLRLGGFQLLGSVLFFIISNLGVWLMNPTIYPHNLSGLQNCFILAIPFFRSTLTSDLFFGTVLFGTYYLVQKVVAMPLSESNDR